MRWLLYTAVAATSAALAVNAPTAEAGHCGGMITYAPHYRYPVYHAPGYCAPVVKVQHAVAVHEPPLLVQPVVIQEQLAPAFVFQVLSAYQQPTYPVSYTGGGGQQQQSGFSFSGQQKPQSFQASQQASGGLTDAQLDALAEKLLRRLGGGKTGQSDPVPTLSGGGSDHQQANGGAGNGPTAGERRVIEYMASACVECHREPQSKGGVVLFNSAGDFAPRRTSGQPITPGQVYESMSSGAMPPRGPKVTQDVLAGVSNWQEGR